MALHVHVYKGIELSASTIHRMAIPSDGGTVGIGNVIELLMCLKDNENGHL